MLVTISLLIVVAIVAVVAVPLALRLIPPNRVYGVRTRRTRKDEKLWFEVNAFGGKALLVACGVVAALLMMYQGTWLRPAWAQVLALLVPIGIAVGATLAYERRRAR